MDIEWNKLTHWEPIAAHEKLFFLDTKTEYKKVPEKLTIFCRSNENKRVNSDWDIKGQYMLLKWKGQKLEMTKKFW